MNNTEENYQINLYRLSNEVINEIYQALLFYGKHSITKNQVLIERAFRDIGNIYSVVDNKSNSTTVTAPTNSNANENPLAAIALQNTLQAFEQFLNKAEASVEDADASKLNFILLIKDTYKNMVLNTLNKNNNNG
jgi:hypothetical protein